MRSLNLSQRGPTHEALKPCGNELASRLMLLPSQDRAFTRRCAYPSMLLSGTLDPENVWQLELSEPPAAVLGGEQRCEGLSNLVRPAEAPNPNGRCKV